MSVSVTPFANAAQQGLPAAGGLFTTITSAMQVIFSSIHVGVLTAHGFDAGPDYWGYVGSFGSIANDTYDDGSSISRTVSSCYHTDIGTLSFGLDQINAPDTDNTFVSLDIDGNIFTRASASNYLASSDGGTIWTWTSVSDPFTGSNPDDFTVNI